jgi:hypothetical protein
MPVVREMTLEEYFEQRRRVVASLAKDKAPDKRADDPRRLPPLKTAA